MTDATTNAHTDTDTLYCANHPTVATSLRCNKCNKPICHKCAVLTPVGYRCRECVRGQQQVFETVVWYAFGLAALLLGGRGGGLFSLLSLLWPVVYVALATGTFYTRLRGISI